MRAAALIVACVVFVWVSARAEDAGAELLPGASWFPGAGSFEVVAHVAAVTPGANGAAKVEFRTSTKVSVVGQNGWEAIRRRPRRGAGIR